MTRRHHVFVAGGTGYVGRRLVEHLATRGHRVHVLTRPGSEGSVDQRAVTIVGDALQESTYDQHIGAADTFVHLLGVSHPGPAKAIQFRAIDRVAAEAAIKAATRTNISHFIYMSVAHPAPVMKPYIEVRIECENMLRESSLNATIFRPWYVLGPGHRWPYVLLPAYRVLGLIPSTRDLAARLGLVTIHQMVDALVWSVENPCVSGKNDRCLRILGVPEIRTLKPDLG